MTAFTAPLVLGLHGVVHLLGEFVVQFLELADHGIGPTRQRVQLVAHLPALLRPDAGTPEQGKAAFRSYEQALEALTTSA
ncbi:hypothetical protein GCM10010234_81210 [Streptomyces hawaiiensis]|uniref:hypothetical protein n=1 Tax=Streptomyces hawaiiensis TaxID=67305 RepID=UPI0031D148FD